MASEEPSEGEDGDVNPRLADYKSRTWKIDQESRRNQLLEEQKRRREDNFNSLRDFTDIFNSDDDDEEDHHEEEMDFECQEVVKERKDPKSSRVQHLFMFSEWMTHLPADFEDNWVMKVCPFGKRCMVRTSRGFTTVYNKTGYQMARFKSVLPSGGHQDIKSDTLNSKSGVTVLDCIWCSNVQMFFILDIVYWRNQFYIDTDVEFRNFWMVSKLEELPSLSRKSKRNPYPFHILPSYACDMNTISRVMSQYPHFQSGNLQVDGLLFYHKQGHYTPGTTPLVLWLKPYMLEEIFGQNVCVAEEYMQKRPKSYTNMHEFISGYEEIKKQKKTRRKGKKQESADEGCKMDE